jgi:L-alanine-DL-glutamate epimerase-like enolase superfamily enzyme
MQITGLTFRRLSMGLREPYRIAYETVDRVDNVFLQIETDTGVTGIGCAAPDLAVTGETCDSVEKALDEATGFLVGRDPLRFAALQEDMREALRPHPSARAALDMAAFDILGKVAGLPVYVLLGGFRERILTSVTIGILPETETVAAARERAAQGFLALKLKGGLDVEGDAARVLAVRRAVGPGIALRFDANQGYTAEQTMSFLEACASAGLELLEQPTPKGEPDLMERVTRDALLPIMADESLLTLRDAFRIARDDLADMVNVKLMKVGGIAEAVQINSVARAARLETMVGCMDESGLAIAAGLHFALARPNVAFADLDGHLDLVGDPYGDAVRLENGYLYPSGDPGLGVPDRLFI